MKEKVENGTELFHTEKIPKILLKIAPPVSTPIWQDSMRRNFMTGLRRQREPAWSWNLSHG